MEREEEEEREREREICKWYCNAAGIITWPVGYNEVRGSLMAGHER